MEPPFRPFGHQDFPYQDLLVRIIASDDRALEASTGNGVRLVPFEPERDPLVASGIRRRADRSSVFLQKEHFMYIGLGTIIVIIIIVLLLRGR